MGWGGDGVWCGEVGCGVGGKRGEAGCGGVGRMQVYVGHSIESSLTDIQ